MKRFCLLRAYRGLKLSRNGGKLLREACLLRAYRGLKRVPFLKLSHDMRRLLRAYRGLKLEIKGSCNDFPLSLLRAYRGLKQTLKRISSSESMPVYYVPIGD